MHPVRQKRLIMVSMVVFGLALAIGLLLFALRNNINHFYTPTELALEPKALAYDVRLGGVVKEGSVQRQSTSLQVVFIVTDRQADISVSYTGILPDLFREGQGVVVIGRYRGKGEFVADQVLAKHDENYMPPEAYEALKKAQSY